MSHTSKFNLCVLILPCLLMGCVDSEVFDAVPDAPVAAKSGENWPSLAPRSLFEAREANNQQAAKDNEAKALQLQSRVARLRAKAARLRGPVLTPSTRAKLKRAAAAS